MLVPLSASLFGARERRMQMHARGARHLPEVRQLVAVRLAGYDGEADERQSCAEASHLCAARARGHRERTKISIDGCTRGPKSCSCTQDSFLPRAQGAPRGLWRRAHLEWRLTANPRPLQREAFETFQAARQD